VFDRVQAAIEFAGHRVGDVFKRTRQCEIQGTRLKRRFREIKGVVAELFPAHWVSTLEARNLLPAGDFSESDRYIIPCGKGRRLYLAVDCDGLVVLDAGLILGVGRRQPRQIPVEIESRYLVSLTLVIIDRPRMNISKRGGKGKPANIIGATLILNAKCDFTVLDGS
jgi:hypothetical protein